MLYTFPAVRAPAASGAARSTAPVPARKVRRFITGSRRRLSAVVGYTGRGATGLASWRALLQLPQGRLEQRLDLPVSGPPLLNLSATTPFSAAGGGADGLTAPELDHLTNGASRGAYRKALPTLGPWPYESATFYGVQREDCAQTITANQRLSAAIHSAGRPHMPGVTGSSPVSSTNAHTKGRGEIPGLFVFRLRRLGLRVVAGDDLVAAVRGGLLEAALDAREQDRLVMAVAREGHESHR